MTELQGIIKKLREGNVKRIFIQFAEGLKLRIQEIVKKIEDEGIEVILSLEPTYGACDLRIEEAKRLGCDAILHIGHGEFIKVNFPVFYWEYFLEADPLPILEKGSWKIEKFDKIGLITSLQFVKLIPLVKDFLEEKGKEVFIHKSLDYPGQILGCNLKAAEEIEDKVDCFLCISAGKFYGLGIVLKTRKPVFCLDLEKREIYSLEPLRKKIEKIIAWNISKIKDAKKIGLLISWKVGQIKSPFKIKKILENKGKEVYVLAMDEITPEKLEGLKLDGLINLACPRIGIDDLERYKTPLVNVDFIEEI